jgi:solute:Na+ symporter, SSS family
VWGVFGIGVGVAMIGVKSVLDAWWAWASIFSGGMLGLFLLGLAWRRAGAVAAAAGVVCGILVIIWMSLFPAGPASVSPEGLDRLRSPFHPNMIIVIGTLTIFIVGAVTSLLWPRRQTVQTSKSQPQSVIY